MTKEDLDAILAAMLQGPETSVSDLVFVTGKPPQIEREGCLKPLEMDGPDPVLQAAHVEAMSDVLMVDNPRLRSDFEQNGSCDLSYSLGDQACFRVNIYKQNGQRGIVMRRLQSKIPTVADLNLPPIFQAMIKALPSLFSSASSAAAGLYDRPNAFFTGNKATTFYLVRRPQTRLLSARLAQW